MLTPAFHVTGPVHHFIRMGAFGYAGSDPSASQPNGNIWYLGTCETQPQIRINRYGRPIFNDIGGRSVPMQETMDGQDADLGMMLSRFSQQTYQILQVGAPASATEITPGGETLLSRGALLYGPRTFELWQFFSYYGSTNQPSATDGCPIGYYWPQVKLGQHGPEKLGSEGEVLMLACKATPRWIAPLAGGTTGVGGTGGRFVLFSQAPADFPAVTQRAY